MNNDILTSLPEEKLPITESQFNAVNDWLTEQVLSRGIQYAFTGTVAFNAWKVYDRKPNDLDLVVDEKQWGTFHNVLAEGRHREFTGSDAEESITISLHGVMVDFFPVDIDEQGEVIETKEYWKRIIKVCHPKKAVEAKLRYLQNRVDQLSRSTTLSPKMLQSLIKHAEDINQYNLWLETRDLF